MECQSGGRYATVETEESPGEVLPNKLKEDFIKFFGTWMLANPVDFRVQSRKRQ